MQFSSFHNSHKQMSSCFTLNQHRQLQGKGCIALSHLFKKNWTLPTFSPSHHIFMYLETQTLRPGRIIAFGASLRRNCGPRSKGSWIFFRLWGGSKPRQAACHPFLTCIWAFSWSLRASPAVHHCIRMVRTGSLTSIPYLDRGVSRTAMPIPVCSGGRHFWA